MESSKISSAEVQPLRKNNDNARKLRFLPKALSSKRKECGQVEFEGSSTYSSVLFHLVYPDGSKSIKFLSSKNRANQPQKPQCLMLWPSYSPCLLVNFDVVHSWWFQILIFDHRNGMVILNDQHFFGVETTNHWTHWKIPYLSGILIETQNPIFLAF